MKLIINGTKVKQSQGKKEDSDVHFGHVCLICLLKGVQIHKKRTKQIKINGLRVHCIWFADDIVVFGDPEKDMCNMPLSFTLK